MGPLLVILELLVVAYSPVVDRLGAVEFDGREAAQSELRAAGIWAYPAVRAGALSPSPEVSRRCLALSHRWEGLRFRVRAWMILLSAFPSDPDTFNADWELREWVRHLSCRYGADENMVWGLRPDEDLDIVTRWRMGYKYPMSYAALDRCRGMFERQLFPSGRSGR